MGQEATGRTLQGTSDRFKIQKGVWQGCILSPCLFNLNVQYIMQNAWLDELQVRIKLARRNINNLRYTGDITLVAEIGKELNSLLKVNEESEKSGLKLSIHKTKIMTSGLITSWQIEEKKEKATEKRKVTDFLFFFFFQIFFLNSIIITDGDCSHEIRRHLHLGRKDMTNLNSVLKSKDITAKKGPYSQSCGFSSSLDWM